MAHELQKLTSCHSEYREARRERFYQTMASESVDLMFVCSKENVFYLSGFTGSEGILVLAQNQGCFLLVDFRYGEQAKAEAAGCEVVRLDVMNWESVMEWVEKNRDVCCQHKSDRTGSSAEKLVAGIEEEHFSWGFYTKNKHLFESYQVEFFSHKLTEQRWIKDAAELEIMEAAAALTDRGFACILKEIRPGRTEREIALALEFALRDWGADGCSFEFIVASGERSSMPHGVSSRRVMQQGDLVTLDFGIRYGGYSSDMTRTVCLGEPTVRQREIYDIVLLAQETGLRALKAGKTGIEVDACARAVIEAAGYGPQFGHGLGHGVGISVHETPRLNKRDETVLTPGMVVTVEPGIYIPGWGGVRIEDMAVVTENEAKVLTQSPKTFIIIE